LSASTVSNPTISLFSQKDSRPLRKIENKKVEMVTPCFTPLQHGKKFDVQLLFITHDLTFSYICRIA
jgi:hypothetical protein